MTLPDFFIVDVSIAATVWRYGSPTFRFFLLHLLFSVSFIGFGGILFPSVELNGSVLLSHCSGRKSFVETRATTCGPRCSAPSVLSLTNFH